MIVKFTHTNTHTHTHSDVLEKSDHERGRLRIIAEIFHVSSQEGRGEEKQVSSPWGAEKQLEGIEKSKNKNKKKRQSF